MNYTVFYHNGTENVKRTYSSVKSAQSFCRKNGLTAIIRNIDLYAGEHNMFERIYSNGVQIGSRWNPITNSFPY